MDFTLATRRLCAGTYLDSRFCQRVLLDAYADRARFVAPSYGFDLAQVAVHARRAWWLDTAQHVAMALVILAALATSPLALVLAGGLLMTWHIVVAGARLAADLSRYLRDRRSLHELTNFKVRVRLLAITAVVTWAVMITAAIVALGFDAVAALGRNNRDALPLIQALQQAAAILAAALGVVLIAALCRQILVWRMLVNGPISARRLNRRMRHIAVEERSAVTYYAGFRPFIGSGEELATWSFALRLMRKREDGTSEKEGAREEDVIPFPAKKLVGRMRRELKRLVKEPDSEKTLPNLKVTDRAFVVGSYAKHVSGDNKEVIAKAREDPTGPARHYLACKVEAWDGEVVTTVFVHTSLQGRVLFVEFSVWALLPTRPDFHIRQITDHRNLRAYLPDIARRLVYLPEEVRRLPADLWTVAQFAGRYLRSAGRVGPRRIMRDPGARYSVREDGGISRYVARVAARSPTDLVGYQHKNVLLIEEADPAQERHALGAVREAERLTRQAGRAVNYFQTRDVERHWKIIERRVLAAILDFLEDEGLDTADYHNQATRIMNMSLSFEGPVDARGASFGSGAVHNTTNNTAAGSA